MKNAARQQRGFTILEALVVIVILGIAASAFASLMAMQAKGYVVSTENMDIIQLRSTLISNLSVASQCTCNFRGKSVASTLTGVDISQYSVDPTTGNCSAGSVIVKQGALPGTKLSVSSVALENLTPLSASAYTGDLVVHLNQGAGPPRRPIVIDKLMFDTDSSGGSPSVVKCKIGNGNRITKVMMSSTYSPSANTHQKMPVWDVVIKDELGAYNPSQPARLTVPPGVSRVRLYFSACWEILPPPLHRMGYVVKNSWGPGNNAAHDEFDFSLTSSSSHRFATNAASQPIDVSPGEFFEAWVYTFQSGETILKKGDCNTDTVFTMEALE